jgi:hypothetical protein
MSIWKHISLLQRMAPVLMEIYGSANTQGCITPSEIGGEAFRPPFGPATLCRVHTTRYRVCRGKVCPSFFLFRQQQYSVKFR